MSQTSAEAQPAESKTVDHILMNQKVVIFSCGVNKRVERVRHMIQGGGFRYFEFEFHLDAKPRHESLVQYLRDMNPAIKARKFPHVFVGKWYIGSVEETDEAIKNGELHTLYFKPLDELHCEEIKVAETLTKLEKGEKYEPQVVTPESPAVIDEKEQRQPPREEGQEKSKEEEKEKGKAIPRERERQEPAVIGDKRVESQEEQVSDESKEKKKEKEKEKKKVIPEEEEHKGSHGVTGDKEKLESPKEEVTQETKEKEKEMPKEMPKEKEIPKEQEHQDSPAVTREKEKVESPKDQETSEEAKEKEKEVPKASEIQESKKVVSEEPYEPESVRTQ
jgi:glutaredoxin